MTKSNYKKMSHEELKKYVLLHRDGDKAICELFVNRRNPNAKINPANQTTDEIKQIILDKIPTKFGFVQFEPILESNRNKPNTSPITTD